MLRRMFSYLRVSLGWGAGGEFLDLKHWASLLGWDIGKLLTTDTSVGRGCWVFVFPLWVCLLISFAHFPTALFTFFFKDQFEGVIYSWYKSFFSYICGKYFRSVCGLFHSLKRMFCCIEVYNCNVVIWPNDK